MSEIDKRLEQANELFKVIANCGRKFFSHNDRVSRFEIDGRGRVWFIDAYREARIYTHYIQGHWQGFSEGDTLRDLVIQLRDYILTGEQIGKVFGPFPSWYSDGDPWGYGSDMQFVYQSAAHLAIVSAPNTAYTGQKPAYERENLGVEEGMTATSMGLEPRRASGQTGTQISAVSEPY